MKCREIKMQLMGRRTLLLVRAIWSRATRTLLRERVIRWKAIKITLEVRGMLRWDRRIRRVGMRIVSLVMRIVPMVIRIWFMEKAIRLTAIST